MENLADERAQELIKETTTESNTKIDDDNITQFDRYTKTQALADARHIYRTVFAGDLATFGRKKSRTEGYPFGSVSSFIIDHTGCPVIYTAHIAEHTKNAKDNGKASLMLRQVEKQHHVETGWRLTCAGDLTEIIDEDRERVANSYFRFYPKAKSYDNVHDFCFFRLNIVVARVIMGFGRISWIEPTDLMSASTLTGQQESQIIDHMNEDHQIAMKHYLNKMGIDTSHSSKSPKMVAIHQLGATISYRQRLYFVAFDKTAHDPMAIREQLVNLAQS